MNPETPLNPPEKREGDAAMSTPVIYLKLEKENDELRAAIAATTARLEHLSAEYKALEDVCESRRAAIIALTARLEAAEKAGAGFKWNSICAQRDDATTKLKVAREALEWYYRICNSFKDARPKTASEPVNHILMDGLVNQLVLDGGQRAQSALDATKHEDRTW